ncbi:MAG: hypothetical protein ACK4FZ_12470, partial [Vogesella sp.]|uniref:hypothetical protein n=1 Tax=Vogesella sp. TaxID=1904252 RepID=UPI0039190C7D
NGRIVLGRGAAWLCQYPSEATSAAGDKSGVKMCQNARDATSGRNASQLTLTGIFLVWGVCCVEVR